MNNLAATLRAHGDLAGARALESGCWRLSAGCSAKSTRPRSPR